MPPSRTHGRDPFRVRGSVLAVVDVATPSRTPERDDDSATTRPADRRGHTERRLPPSSVGPSPPSGSLGSKCAKNRLSGERESVESASFVPVSQPLVASVPSLRRSPSTSVLSHVHVAMAVGRADQHPLQLKCTLPRSRVVVLGMPGEGKTLTAKNGKIAPRPPDSLSRTVALLVGLCVRRREALSPRPRRPPSRGRPENNRPSSVARGSDPVSIVALFRGTPSLSTPPSETSTRLLFFRDDSSKNEKDTKDESIRGVDSPGWLMLSSCFVPVLPC